MIAGDDYPEGGDAISSAAADWIVKRDRGLSPAESAELARWLAADTRHREWFAHHERHWEAFDVLTETPAPSARAAPRRAFRRAAALAGLAAAACLALLWILRFPATTLEAASYAKRELADGSIVELNANTTVEVRFRPHERSVRLVRGEALFTVAKDSARPFIVRAGDVAVRAVGTAFNVRLAPAAVEVLVTEGRVTIADAAPPAGARERAAVPSVQAGERAVISRADDQTPRIVATTDDEVRRLLAWQPCLLDFSSTPLHEVVAIFNRHNRVQLVLGDPELRTTPVVASIRSDNLAGFLRILELTSDIRGERRADTIFLRKAN